MIGNRLILSFYFISLIVNYGSCRLCYWAGPYLAQAHPWWAYKPNPIGIERIGNSHWGRSTARTDTSGCLMNSDKFVFVILWVTQKGFACLPALIRCTISNMSCFNKGTRHMAPWQVISESRRKRGMISRSRSGWICHTAREILH